MGAGIHGQGRQQARPTTAAGRLRLVHGSIESLDTAAVPGPYAKAFTVNTVMFWHDPGRVFRLVRERLTAGGSVYVTHQPRTGKLTSEAALA
jgi:shikimate kinase